MSRDDLDRHLVSLLRRMGRLPHGHRTVGITRSSIQHVKPECRALKILEVRITEAFISDLVVYQMAQAVRAR